jgi:hypothetical protein
MKMPGVELDNVAVTADALTTPRFFNSMFS